MNGEKMPCVATVKKALTEAAQLCRDKGVPMTRHRVAAQLGVSVRVMERWAAQDNGAAALLRAAIQEGEAQVLEYCLRTDVRHEQLALQYLKGTQSGESAGVVFAGEEQL